MTLKIEGHYHFKVASEVVYQALQDEMLIRAAMPGGLHFGRLSPTTFEAEMEVSLPRVSGRYAGTITVADTILNEFYVLVVQGSGSHSHVTAEGRVSLDPRAGGTLLRYQGETDAIGGLNRLTHRVVQRVAVELINLGLRRLEAEIHRQAGSRPEYDTWGG
ncbi:MAG: SRPBCC domain-containing protein [Ardenticatenaceae bacterium]|nr:SRPBCC domain-containing protein [Ardenticatenaceae bacterium]HBY94584.1 hypothetical protein [Chloroflexota bacterium]